MRTSARKHEARTFAWALPAFCMPTSAGSKPPSFSWRGDLAHIVSSRTVYCTGTWRLQNTVFYWDYDDGFKPSRVHCKRLQAVTVTDAVEPARGGTVSK